MRRRLCGKAGGSIRHSRPRGQQQCSSAAPILKHALVPKRRGPSRAYLHSTVEFSRDEDNSPLLLKVKWEIVWTSTLLSVPGPTKLALSMTVSSNVAPSDWAEFRPCDTPVRWYVSPVAVPTPVMPCGWKWPLKSVWLSDRKSVV